MLIPAFFVRLFTFHGHPVPDARERIPTGAKEVARSYQLYGAYRRINSNQKLPHAHPATALQTNAYRFNSGKNRRRFADLMLGG
jgi:hypothetical protein